MAHDTQTVSYWADRRTGPTYPALQQDIQADVAILGGGITGMVAAMLLKHSGKRVCLLEMNRVGSGTTGQSTGHLATASDHPYHEIARKFSDDAAASVFDARASAIDLIERLNHDLNLGADFHRVPGYLYAERGMDTESIEREAELLIRLGRNVRPDAHCPLPFDVVASLLFPDQARFSPLRFVEGLAHAFVGERCSIYEHTRVQDTQRGEGESWKIVTPQGAVSARAVIIAMHAPSFAFFSLENRAFPFQSYVINVRVEDRLPDALYWDTVSPYHYTRWAGSDQPDLLMIGGADHRTGEVHDTGERLDDLESYARDRYRMRAVEQRWSSEYYEPADGLPYIGRVANTSNLFIGAGYSGDGLVYGALAGQMLSDMVQGKESPWRDLFLPTRIKPAASAAQVLAGAARVARHFVGDRLGAQVRSIDQIEPGHGATVWVNGDLIAAYRDETGQLHCVSPVCTHAGCIVQWNQLEKTWDCPCHGGRYTAEGKVISAPPPKDLEARPAPVQAAAK